MNFRVFNQKFLEPGSMWLMIFGIIFLCQPWIQILHDYSVTVMLIGLIGFNVAAHVAPPDPKADEEVPGQVSVSEVMKSGGGHG